MQDMLLASSYLPVFKNEKLHGKTYMDGGVTNVLPVNALLDRGYENLILIRIFGVGHEKKITIPDQVTVLEIAPRTGLGSILQFDGAKSRRNMRIGYFDAMRMLYGLEGRIYYIEQKEEECYYLKQLVQIAPEALKLLLDGYKPEREAGGELRCYMEKILPQIAAELKLGSNWNYKTLYLSMLEACARLLRIRKYQIYTVDELLGAVRKKAADGGLPEEIPAFVHVILNQGVFGKDITEAE